MGKIHLSHKDHKLELKSYKRPYFCSGCKEPGFGSRYRCGQCDYELHKHCMSPPGRTVHHDFFKNSTFTFLFQPPGNRSGEKCQRYCKACGKLVKGFVFHDEKNGWDLHPCCRKLPRKLTVGGVEFALCDKVSSTCLFCNKKKRERTVSGFRGWSYVSKTENLHFHVSCPTEWKLEVWGKGATYDNEDSLALARVELPIQRYNWNGRSGNIFIRMVKVIVKASVAILLGDPIAALTGIYDLVAN
ncbi:uncharacterized protein LOC123227097 isoform X1 [Mangifera indica]|uniref:uncharacterized protein LOC123227097 isoform X1 n=1 Tax=Mangifera indica TaxID=29780 RepID=UPI001CFA36D8|nr:uncharacterized protein LOC123227097 isoform X1 [Mangifera indica]XP_044507682.1 uncharacterized protein LOC123227097 isoform X1 [Mangifera indica]XP_044507683.1 uncharacterized protein LOC123227097 isoform X1 [Mangifera indica]XP_044507684.1 uncharacterized protein LOC123227097 isoform X1 [Mangifera indica]